MQELPSLGERIDDHRVGRIDPEAGHHRGVGQEAPVVADSGLVNRQAVALPDGEILHLTCLVRCVRAPVPASRVTMLPEHDRHLPVLQGVLQLQSLKGAGPSNCAKHGRQPRARPNAP